MMEEQLCCGQKLIDIPQSFPFCKQMTVQSNLTFFDYKVVYFPHKTLLHCFLYQNRQTLKAFLYFPMRCSEADATKREEFLKLEPMQRELLEQLPDLQLLLFVQQGIPFIFKVNNDDRKVVICSSHHSHASTKSYDDIFYKQRKY